MTGGVLVLFWPTDGNKRMSVRKSRKKEKSKREITDEAVETANHVVGVKQWPVRRLHAAYRPAHLWNKLPLFPLLHVNPQTHSLKCSLAYFFYFFLFIFPILACLFSFLVICMLIWVAQYHLTWLHQHQQGDKSGIHTQYIPPPVADPSGLLPSSFPYPLSYSLQTKL